MELMEWFTNLLNSSWLSGVELFGVNGWWLLLIGIIVIAAIFTVLRLVFGSWAYAPLLTAAAIIVSVALLCFIAWPDLWFWPAVFLLIGIIVLIVVFLKAVGFVVIVAILTAIAVLIATLLGLFGVPPITGSSDVCATSESQIPETRYYTLDEGKETNHAFGPAVTQTDEAGIKSELLTRICADPALAASVFAASGHIATGLIDEYTARFNASRTLWNQAVEQIVLFTGESQFSIESVSTGVSTLYMVPQADGRILVKQGLTVGEGTAAVFTHSDGRVMKLRLDCGFQPVFPEPPTDVPYCAPEECLTPKDREDDVTAPEGTVPLGPGPLTPDNLSEEQQANGDVSGNITDNKVPNGTQAGDTTSDLHGGTTTAPGANSGGDNQNNGTVDNNVTNQNPGGTNGDTEIAEPAD